MRCLNIKPEQWAMMYWLHLMSFRLKLSERIVHTALVLLQRLFLVCPRVFDAPLAWTASLLYLTSKVFADNFPHWNDLAVNIAPADLARLEPQIAQILNWDLSPPINLDYLTPEYQTPNAYYLLRLTTLLDCGPEDQVRMVCSVLDGRSIDPGLAELVNIDEFFRHHMPVTLDVLPEPHPHRCRPFHHASRLAVQYVGDWTMPGTRIGGGAYGSVYLHEGLAWKEFTPTPDLDPGIIRELALAQKNLRGLLPATALVQSTRHIYLVMPYGGHSLYHCLVTRVDLPLRKVWRQMALNLYHIHQAGYIHRDVKLENFVYDQNVALIDPGLSIRTEEFPKSLTVYTANYRAPEILLGYDYDTAADVWALGKCFLQLYLGVLFSDKVDSIPLYLLVQACADFGRPGTPLPKEVLELLNAQPRYYTGKIWHRVCDPGLQRLLRDMLDFDPRRRPSLLEVLQALN